MCLALFSLAFRTHYECYHRHHNQCVLFAGKGHNTTPVGQRYAINYLSIYDNKLLRKFRGHSDMVTDISMSPADDTFLSSSKDRTVRLWNIQEAGSLAQLELPSNAAGTPHAAFDSTGLVFAVTATMADGKGQVCTPALLTCVKATTSITFVEKGSARFFYVRLFGLRSRFQSPPPLTVCTVLFLVLSCVFSLKVCAFV